MILIVTRRDDVHADMVINELDELGQSFFRLNTEAFHEYRVSLSTEGGEVENTLTHYKIDLSEVKAVWVRRRSTPILELESNRYSSFVDQEWTKTLRNMWSVLENCFWVSDPYAIDLASDKLRQLRLAKSLGFLIPETVDTNAKNSVIKLQEKWGRCIYKPHDGSSIDRSLNEIIYTNVIDQSLWNDPESEARMMLCPGIFQPYIEKEDEVRVTVVGDRLFATRIDSQASARSAVDWRRYDFDKVKHEAISLPKEESLRCVKLVKSLNLQFGAIDMIVTPKGEYYFLEINANGQWAWLQVLTKQNIASAIANLLAR